MLSLHRSHDLISDVVFTDNKTLEVVLANPFGVVAVPFVDAKHGTNVSNVALYGMLQLSGLFNLLRLISRLVCC